MSVKENIPLERPCSNCGAIYIPAVLTQPDASTDLCSVCTDGWYSAYMQRQKELHRRAEAKQLADDAMKERLRRVALNSTYGHFRKR